ncbi:MAG: PAS domain-containing protein [Flavobacterium sp.]|nr:MAG: PAS domain-containing protein [Flavobacterium sp.]
MPSKKTPPHYDTINFPIVGVGASAGGLDAFRKFIRNITLDSGMAYVLVQHLAASHESLLPEILQKETTLPVYEITDEINLAPNRIYIIPENKVLTAFDGKLKLTPRLNDAKKNLPIDVFFTSLAEVHNGFARAVVLSGTGFDGTLGLKSIKEWGGITFVQDPETAGFPGMPQNAINIGAADFVLNVEDIPSKLVTVDRAYESSYAYNEEDDTLPGPGEDTFKQILRLLRIKTGNDFSHYKQPTIRRRIARRMVVTKLENPNDYLKFLRNDKNELDLLFNDILIPVSYFFRDKEIFESLNKTVFPLILQKKSADQGIRIWVAGCSTGEEAYSIAICLHEFLAEKNEDIKVQVFASDISENVITKARAGIYNSEELQNVSELRLKNYFTKTDGAYYIKKEIRDTCVFAVHNFVKDPPFAKMDLITCRNVLIYLDPFLQKKSLTTFHYALKSHGTLFLGKSESVGPAANLFEPLVKNSKIYSRVNSASTFAPRSSGRHEVSLQHEDKSSPARKRQDAEPDFQKIAADIIFSRYTPAGVIINEHKDIVHFHGDTGDFLAPAPGRANFNIFKMVREGLAFELRNAIVKAKATNSNVIKDNIILKSQGYAVNVEIIPLPGVTEPHYLILFRKCLMPDDEAGNNNKKSADQHRIKQLEAEIEQMREDIRRVTEDQEAANEELQSANEELLSNSEELQTLNEELETSAEELQSNNEELITVNDELMDRQEQLSISRMYSEAIIETIREPLIVLDKNMRVKSANASYYRVFSTSERDTEGRVLFDVGFAQWNIPGLREQFEMALRQRTGFENYEIKTTFPEIGERTMLLNVRPILNESLTDQLILVAIEDVSDIRNANLLLTLNNRSLEENNKELTSFSYIASHDLQEPLRKIYTFSKLIIDNEDEVQSETTKKYLERIMVSTLRMRQLIEDLLDYSRINNLEANFDETEIVSIIEESKTEIIDNQNSKDASITIGELPSLKVLPVLIRQLFINLIGNALKYSKPGTSPVIKISAVNVDGKETVLLGGDEKLKYCRITIEDNGIGFPQEQALRIFEPFQRLHSKDNYEGTGIGLAICKKIMVKHRGLIAADSKPGVGSNFYLYFPVEA